MFDNSLYVGGTNALTVYVSTDGSHWQITSTTTFSLRAATSYNGKLYMAGFQTAGYPASAIISADGRVKHAQVVTIIDLLRQEKITKFAINTSPLDIKKAK